MVSSEGLLFGINPDREKQLSAAFLKARSRRVGLAQDVSLRRGGNANIVGPVTKKAPEGAFLAEYSRP